LTPQIAREPSYSPIEVLLLDRDDLGGVLAGGVPPERFLVEFEERLAPRELRHNPFGVVKLAEDRERGRERLDGGELHRTPEVHGVGGDEVRERAMLAGEAEHLLAR